MTTDANTRGEKPPVECGECGCREFRYLHDKVSECEEGKCQRTDKGKPCELVICVECGADRP